MSNNLQALDTHSKAYCVIMAGGIGSRFWPLSKDGYPKQFIDILGIGKSFIRSTFERFLPIVDIDHFVVVTNAAYRDLVAKHLPELAPSQILCEPERRNTAPCIAFATRHIMATCNNENVPIIVAPSDHYIANNDAFINTLSKGLTFLKTNSDALMTISIKPTRPETGYGYIELPTSCDSEGIVKVQAFKEKPDIKTAIKFIAAGNYNWNSGIFMWTAKGIWSALQTHLPEITNLFEQDSSCWGTENEQQHVNTFFSQCKNISIDYGVLEQTTHCYTLTAEFDWSDVGTWGSLYELSEHDQNGNSTDGQIVTIDSNNCLINIEKGTEAVVEGLNDYLVAFHNNALIVCRLQNEQHIKEWTAQLTAHKDINT